MRKITLFANYLAVCSLALFSSSANAVCPTNNFAITKLGYYGAVNSEKYGEMSDALEHNNKSKLASLISENSVIKIPSGKKVCIIDIAPTWYRNQIEIPGLAVLYWVKDEALTENR